MEKTLVKRLIWLPLIYFYSDFRNEINGIFVARGVFFLQTNFDFLNSHFLLIFFYYCSKSIVVLSLNLKKYFTSDLFS